MADSRETEETPAVSTQGGPVYASMASIMALTVRTGMPRIAAIGENIDGIFRTVDIGVLIVSVTPFVASTKIEVSPHGNTHRVRHLSAASSLTLVVGLIFETHREMAEAGPSPIRRPIPMNLS